ncbi:MAG: AAA family ATPase [Myxococcales bacterium]|nr:AAA family ATPase [Myxococcales bacterium]
MSAHRSRFALQCERIRLRAMRMVERAKRGDLEDAIRRELESTQAQLEAAAPANPSDDRMQLLASRMGLSPDDVELGWASVALACDPRLAPHIEALSGERPKLGLSLVGFAALAQLPMARCVALGMSLSSGHPWISSGLLELGEGSVGTLRPVTASGRLCRYLAGDNAPDDDVATYGGTVELPEALVFSPGQMVALARLRQAFSLTDKPVIQLAGVSWTGRRTALAHVAAEHNLAVVFVDLSLVGNNRANIERVLRGLRREAMLRPAIPMVVGIESIAAGEQPDQERLRAVANFLDTYAGICGTATTDASVDLPLSRPTWRVAWPVPDGATRSALWKGYLGDASADVQRDIEQTAMRYKMGAGAIRRAVRAARVVASGRDDARITSDDIIEGTRHEISERLGALAMRVDVDQSWEDIVLPPDILDQIRALISRVRHSHKVLDQWGFHRKVGRATGVAALFSGPPGTGKSMVAGIIARDLGLDLYQIDLSKVVSKWVGETEKQLAKIFDAASSGQVLLLFDEADSLFAKRTEVKSSVDRYANLEVNYLLQRIEAFSGITLLTTNLDSSIDPAVRRRLAAHVKFYAPDEGERAELWRRMLAVDAPRAADINADDLAQQFADMTGGNIKNAVIGAAFLAAAEDHHIDHATLERAARSEYSSMGRVLGNGRRR